DASLKELIGQARESTLAAFAQGQYPFDRLIGLLDVPRDMSRTPVFSVMFAPRNETAETAVEVDGLRASPAQIVANEQSRFDLMLTVCDSGSAARLEAEYNTDLY